MVTVLRSANVAARFRPGVLIGRLAGVVYDGPPINSAVVVWSCVFTELAGAVLVAYGLALREGTGLGRLASVDGFLFLGGAGSESRVGGTVIMDLVPGAALGVFGFADDDVSFELAANGLTVAVL